MASPSLHERVVSSRHLTPGELAAYVDRALDAGEQRAAEAHLESCAECRAEALAIVRVVEAHEHAQQPSTDTSSTFAGTTRRREWRIARRVAAIAAGVGAMLLVREVRRQPAAHDSTSVARVAHSEMESFVRPVSPADGAIVPTRAARFVWRASGSESYRFTLLSSSGEPVWSFETSDTSLALPAAVTLRPGLNYFWRVDALADGIAATSGAHQIHAAP